MINLKTEIITMLVMTGVCTCLAGCADPKTNTGKETRIECEDADIDAEIAKIMHLDEEKQIEYAEWVDEGKKLYHVSVGRSEENALEYSHLEDFFFTKENGDVISLAVDYPSKSAPMDSDRYVFEACDFKAEYIDVNFDGHEDIVISLGNQGSGGVSVSCAYVYEDGKFIYKKSFEEIPNYVIDNNEKVITGTYSHGYDQHVEVKYEYKDQEFVLVSEDTASNINGERDINQLITDLEISEYQYPENFNMDDDLRALLENCAIYYSDYDNSRSIDEEWEQGFIHNFCQSSWFGFDYLNSISDDDKSTISKDQVEYIQYSFSGNLIEFKSLKKEDQVAIDEASSGFSYAELLDFEAEDKGDVIDLSMTFSISNAAEGSVEKKGKATLIKNSYSCFGGYSIKTFVLNKEIFMSVKLRQLLEMAKVYRIPKSRVIRYIYIPELLSFLRRGDR